MVPDDGLAGLHRRLVFGSVARTLVVYGGLVAIAAWVPEFVCGAIGAFLLIFYRREAALACRWALRRGNPPAAGAVWPAGRSLEPGAGAP